MNAEGEVAVIDTISEEDRIERMRQALIDIRDHWANQYDHPRKKNAMYDGPYGVGVTDGHRAAAQIARRGLGENVVP